MRRVTVIGAGAWGTALAVQAVRAGGAVTLWARDPARAATIAAERVNPRLPGVALPADLRVTDTLAGCDADLLLLAVPVAHLRAVAARLPAGPVVVCAKGVEAGTLALPLEILASLDPARPAAVLSGPNFSGEIAAGLPAAAVLAGDAAARAAGLAGLATRGLRLYGNDDPLGVQLGGAAKNVVAIAAGAVIGAALGENARAALITRGLAEIARLIVALGGRAETAAGLSGLGDLLLTCTGAASRNYRLGLALGQEATLAEALASCGGVSEGAASAPALRQRAARAGLDLPICGAVAALLAGETTLAQAIADLMARPLRDE
jgi:glycerol-3-phosphate dehydrogenase (NAD(P)+)